MFELTIHTELSAFHSLNEREEVHPHVWKINVCLATNRLNAGRVISLPKAKALVDQMIEPLVGKCLNGDPSLDESTAKEPTCENLSRYLFERLKVPLESSAPNALLQYVEVAVIEQNGTVLGTARYSSPKHAPEP